MYVLIRFELDISQGPCTDIAWKTFYGAFPKEVRLVINSKLYRLHDDTKFEIWSGYVIPQTWIDSLSKTSQDLMTDVAEHIWGIRNKVTPDSNVVRKVLEERLDILDERDKKTFFHLLWSKERSPLLENTMKTFNNRWNGLEFNRQEQFIAYWTAKVVDSTRLYML